MHIHIVKKVKVNKTINSLKKYVSLKMLVSIIISFSDVVKSTPCTPSPCGPNSQCQEVNSQAVCSCQPEFVGTPPNCRPECTINSECATDKACKNRKCIDPCINQCGRNANCRVIAHNPICSCQDHFTGDPFTNCMPSEFRKFFL